MHTHIPILMSFHFFIITTSNELRPCRVASMSLISQYILVFQVMCIYKLFTAALIFFFFFCTYVVTSYFIKTVMLNSMDTLLPQPNARVCAHTCTFRFDHCKLIWNRFLCPPSEKEAYCLSWIVSFYLWSRSYTGPSLTQWVI